MKKITLLLFAMLAFACSDDDSNNLMTVSSPLLGEWKSTLATLSDGTTTELINCNDAFVAEYKMTYYFDTGDNCARTKLCVTPSETISQDYNLSGNTLTITDITAPFASEEYELTFVNETTIVARKMVSATEYIDLKFEKLE